MSSNTISLKELKARVQGHVHTKQASAQAATDPAEKGTATASKDPALSDDKSKLPPSLENISNENKKLEDEPLQPSSTGKNLPVSPKDGNAEDKKGVEKAAGISSRVRKLLNKEAKAEPVAAPAKPAEVSKTAGENEPDLKNLSSDAILKLASAIFETEDGIDAVLPILRKKAGRDAAIELMKAAAAEYQVSQEQRFYQEEMQKRAAFENAQFEQYVAEIVKTASSRQEADQLVKAARVHFENTRDLNEMEKAAYAQGPEDASAMMAAPPEGGGEPQIEGAQEPSLEQIAQLIQLAVQNQEISEEDGAAMLQELAAAAGGAEGGEAPAGEPDGDEGAGAPAAPSEPAPEAAPAPEEEGVSKEASAARNLFKKLRTAK